MKNEKNWEEEYNYWLENVNDEAKKEMESFSKEEKKKFFSNSLSFGTAGIREVIGYSPSLLNEYIIAKYSLGFGKMLLERYGENAKKEGIVIAHDNRRNNILFSETAAKVISGLDIPVYLFEGNKLQPTPLLSFTVAKGNYVGGINITASHNPPSYSGFKVYDDTGTQILPKYTDKIKEFANQEKDIFNIKKTNDNIHYLNNEIITQYIEKIQKLILFNHNVDRSGLKVVFTSQHGTATPIAENIFKRLGVDYTLVKEQCYPDAEFTNTKSPNPQNPDSFILARQYGDKVGADILFSTDPDADRFGIEVKHNNEWVNINGDELPLIQLNFKLKKLNELKYIKDGDFVVKSIVTSEAARNLTDIYGVKMYESLTGFKWIINKALENEMNGDECLFAWEESYGSTIRTFTRDKDSFQALTQVVELADEYKKQGKTLVDVLEDIFKEIGYYDCVQKHIKTEGAKAQEKMNTIINSLRNLKKGDKIGKFTITEKRDFLEGYKDFYKDNILIFFFDKKNKLSIRPSGTEPILRIYFDITSNTPEQLKKDSKNLQEGFNNFIN